MEEHYLLPKGIDETKLVEDRILELSSIVLTPAEWLNLLSAAEAVLPRQKGKRVKPADLDLSALRSQPYMVLFAAVLRAVGTERTFKANRRYQLGDWIRIALSFADISLYVVPPARLDYAVDLCQAAMNAKNPMDAILLINVLSEIDIRVVRQLVAAQKIGEWSAVLIGRLEEQCERGDDIQAHNDDEPYTPDEYEEWLTESQTLVEIASVFYKWSGREEPDDVPRLRHLVEHVDRPPEPYAPEDEDREYSGPSDPSSYWTLERMFEDL